LLFKIDKININMEYEEEVPGPEPEGAVGGWSRGHHWDNDDHHHQPNLNNVLRFSTFNIYF
jgi:hypothetical protein